MKSVSWIFIAAALAGCMPSPRELADRDDETCRSYGLIYGTPNYATCRHSIAANRQAAGAAMLYRPVPPPPQATFVPIQPSAPVTTTCLRNGIMTQCTSQ